MSDKIEIDSRNIWVIVDNYVSTHAKFALQIINVGAMFK